MDNTITCIPFSFPGIPTVHCLFTTRHAGTMSLQEKYATNLARITRIAEIACVAEMRQVHGETIARGRAQVELPVADCLFTDEVGMGLVVRTADCQPILFARDDGAMVAALHLGWRGNSCGYIGSVVDKLCRLFNCSPNRLAAVRGPSLGPAAAEFVNFDSEWPESFAPWFTRDTCTMDLWSLTRMQLARTGIPSGRIYSLDLCTRDMANMFFSHRRGDYGRQVGIIWRTG